MFSKTSTFHIYTYTYLCKYNCAHLRMNRLVYVSTAISPGSSQLKKDLEVTKSKAKEDKANAEMKVGLLCYL